MGIQFNFCPFDNLYIGISVIGAKMDHIDIYCWQRYKHGRLLFYSKKVYHLLFKFAYHFGFGGVSQMLIYSGELNQKRSDGTVILFRNFLSHQDF